MTIIKTNYSPSPWTVPYSRLAEEGNNIN